MRNGIFIISYLLICHLIQAQTFFNTPKYPKGNFISPVKIPFSLAGNFGECRPNHFHSGLDVRTNKVENIPIYAIADGFISRIKIEAGGFGNAIYITHNNGFVSLYAHLNKFYPELETYVRAQQYKQKSWKIDLTLLPTMFAVKQGSFIAFSGNTGSSQAPHLHMEIRDVKTDKPLNGLLFYNQPDNIAPILKKIALYDGNRSIYDQTPKQYNCIKKGTYYIPTNDTLICNTNFVAMGIVADDPMENALGVLGVFEMNLYVDGKPYFGWQLNNIGYDETRYMNAMADYTTKKNGGPWIQLCYKQDGDNLDIYKSFTKLNGKILLDDGKPHDVKLVIKDVNGNSAEAKFWIRSNLSSNYTGNYKLKSGQENKYNDENISFNLSKNQLYDDVPFEASITNNSSAISHMYKVHASNVPLHDYFDLKIKAKATISNNLKQKIAVVRYPTGKETGKKGKAATTDGLWVTANVRDFGTYEIVADTKPPIITCTLSGTLTGNKIICKVDEETTSVMKFVGKIDDKWIRFVQKGNTYTYEVDEYCSSGNHTLSILAEDENGNTATKEISFIKK